MYDQLEATLHDIFWAAEGSDAELPLIEDFLKRFSGTALELGCGSGRLLIPLRDAGYLIEGLDNAPEMLDLCRQKPGGEDLILHQAGMEDFDTGAKYGAITIPAFTLQLIPFELIPDVLENIRRHLQPDGGLYFTTFIPWAEIAGELEEDQWYCDQEAKLDNGNIARCHTRFQIQRLSQQLTREHRYEITSPKGVIGKKGKVLESSESTHSLTWLWPRELTMLLHHAGFEVKQMVSDFDSTSDFDNNGQIITVMAQLRDDDESPE